MLIIARFLRYIVSQWTLGITAILSTALTAQQFLRYLNYAAAGKISTANLLQLVGFEIPYLLSLLLPLGFYLGVLVAFGKMHAQAELIILRVSGISNWRLTAFLSPLIGIIVAIILCLTLWVNPKVALMRQALLLNKREFISVLSPGRFTSKPDGSGVIYIEKLSRNHKEAKHIFVATKIPPSSPNANVAWNIETAANGYEQKNKNEIFFVSNDGYRYEGMKADDDYRVTQFDQYKIRLAFLDQKILPTEIESTSTAKLLQQYANSECAQELLWRISIALAAGILAIVAIFWSETGPRKNYFIVLLPAVMFYMIYFNLLLVVKAKGWGVMSNLGVHAFMIVLAFSLAKASHWFNIQKG